MRASLLILLLLTGLRANESDLSQGRPWIPPQPSTLSDEQRGRLVRFDRAARVKDALPDGKGADTLRLAAVERRIRETWGVRRQADGRVTGLPICTRAADENDGHIWLIRRNDPANAWTAAFGELTACYRRANAEQARRIEQLAADLADHLVSDTARQGRPAFLNSGCLYIWTNRTRDQVLPMRAALERHGSLLPLLRAIPGWANPGWLDEHPPPSDSDSWRGGVLRDLIHSVAAFPDGPEKWQRLAALEHHLSAGLDQDLQHTAISPSGEFIHHGNLHLDYAYALGIYWPDIRLAIEGGIRLTPAARERLRALARTTSWMTVAGYYPCNLSLRPGVPKRPGGTLPLVGLADLGDEAEPAKPDPEMASLALATGAANPTEAKRLREAGIAPVEMNGVLALPQRPGLVWRRGKTAAGVAVLPAGRYGFEIYSRDWPSAQCRYAANGSVLILREGARGPMPGFANAGDGAPFPGWNWAMFPGSTACLESAEALTDTVRNPHGGTASQAGGIALLGDRPLTGRNLQTGEDACGLIAATFSGIKGRVDFNRSVFACGDQLLILSSGIKGKAAGARTITTLYQSRLAAPDAPTRADGAEQRELPSSRSWKLDHPVALTDPDGFAYVALPVPDGKPPTLMVERRRQSWKAAGRTEPGEGDFALAWIDHEGAPTAAHVVRPLGESPLPLPAIRRLDTSGHHAFDPVTRTHAYAAFGADVTWADGPLEKTGISCSVLVREQVNGTAVVSVCSQESDHANRPVQLQLRGRWEAPGSADCVKVQADRDNTVLTFLRRPTLQQFSTRIALRRKE